METKSNQHWSGQAHFDHDPVVTRGADVPFARRKDAAAYVASLIFELRQIAQAANLTRVVGPLEKAYYEAFSVGRQADAGDASLAREAAANAMAKEKG